MGVSYNPLDEQRRRRPIAQPGIAPAGPPPGGFQPGQAPTMPVGTGGLTPINAPITGPNTSATTNPRPARPPTPLMQPGVPGTNITPFGPQAGDLRGGFIAPGTSGRGATATQRTDAAAGNLSTFDRPGSINSYADNFQGRTGYAQQGFRGVNPEINADRSEIARMQMEAFDLENSQNVKDLQREAIQRAAATGRIGMGDEAVNSLRPFVDMMNRRNALAKQLGAETAAGEIGDQERAFERRVSERESEMGLGERNAQRDYDARRAALEMGIGATGADQAGRISTLGIMGDLEGDIYGRESGQREELRGERDYQSMTERMALEDAIRQNRMQRGDFESDRAFDLGEDALAAGFSPAGVYMGAASNYGAQGAAGYGSAGDILAQWLARQRQQQGQSR